jgi:hypothetical protein
MKIAVVSVHGKGEKGESFRADLDCRLIIQCLESAKELGTSAHGFIMHELKAFGVNVKWNIDAMEFSLMEL